MISHRPYRACGSVITAVGATAGVLAVIVALVIYAMQRCDSLRSLRDDLITQRDTAEQTIARARSEKSDLDEKRTQFMALWDVNQEYIRVLELYDDADRYIGMASRAIERIGGEDIGISSRNRDEWRSILEDVGFRINASLRDIMSLITDSSLTASMPIGSILGTPDNAVQFINSLREWQNNKDAEYHTFFSQLLRTFGPNHPRAGPELKTYLSNRLETVKTKIQATEEEISALRTQRQEASGRLRRLRVPWYCSVL